MIGPILAFGLGPSVTLGAGVIAKDGAPTVTVDEGSNSALRDGLVKE